MWVENTLNINVGNLSCCIEILESNRLDDKGESLYCANVYADGHLICVLKEYPIRSIKVIGVYAIKEYYDVMFTRFNTLLKEAD